MVGRTLLNVDSLCAVPAALCDTCAYAHTHSLSHRRCTICGFLVMHRRRLVTSLRVAVARWMMKHAVDASFETHRKRDTYITDESEPLHGDGEAH